MSLNALDPKTKLFPPEVTNTLNDEIRRIDDMISNTYAPKLKAKSKILDVRVNCKGGNIRANSSIKIDNVVLINCAIEADRDFELTLSENVPEIYLQCYNSNNSATIAHCKGNKITVKNNAKQIVYIYGYFI